MEEVTAQKMLDDFWSLQYLVPGGALNAFAGCLRSAGPAPPLTHALHMRFSTLQVKARSRYLTRTLCETLMCMLPAKQQEDRDLQ